MSRELNEIKKLAGLTQLNEYYIYADEEEDPIGKKINDIDRGEMDDLVKKSTAPDPENVKTPMPPMRPGPEPARSPEDKEIGKVLKNAPPGIKMRTIEQNVSASGPWASKPAAPKEVDNRPIPYNPQATAPAASKEVDNRPIPFRPKADTSDIELPGGGTTPYAPSRPPPATAMTGEKDSNPFGKEGAGSRYAQESAKPDYIDADDDGNTVEPMKKALADKERSDESLSWMKRLAGLREDGLEETFRTAYEAAMTEADPPKDYSVYGDKAQAARDNDAYAQYNRDYQGLTGQPMTGPLAPARRDPQPPKPNPLYDPEKAAAAKAALEKSKDDKLAKKGIVRNPDYDLWATANQPQTGKLKSDPWDSDQPQKYIYANQLPDGHPLKPPVATPLLVTPPPTPGPDAEDKPYSPPLYIKPTRSDESLSWMRKLAGLQEALPVFAQPMPTAPKTIKKASAGTPAFADTPSATSSIITPSSVERAAAARQAASSNDDSSAIDAAVDAARDIDPEIVSKEKSWDEKSWDEMTPADKKKYHEVYPPEADQPTVAHSDSGGYHDPGFADRMAYIDSLAGKPEAPFELPPPPTPKLADYTFDQWRAANPDKPMPQGMVVPLVAPGTVLPPIGRIASPEEMLKMQNSPGYKPAEMPPYAVRKDYKPDADQIAESKGILDREQHIAWLQKILDSTNTK